MSRHIDRAPAPAEIKKVKVAVASMSRSGTLGLHTALGILGYKSYHMVELFKNGFPDVNYLIESIDAAWNGNGRRFQREDFDKWLGGYDAITEMCCFTPEDFLAAYAGDPDLKIILTERDPTAWVRSVEATIGEFWLASQKWPLSYCRRFDSYFNDVCVFVDMTIKQWTNGKGLTDEGRAAARQFYLDYIATVKRLVPPERLLSVRLEDGLGWEQICPYLGVPVPDTPWPMKHSAAEFSVVVQNGLGSSVQRGMNRMMATAAVTVAVVATGIWYYLRQH